MVCPEALSPAREAGLTTATDPGSKVSLEEPGAGICPITDTFEYCWHTDWAGGAAGHRVENLEDYRGTRGREIISGRAVAEF
jgi:hypothetical protein